LCCLKLIINIIFITIVGDSTSGPVVDTIPSATSKDKAVKGLPAASDKTAKPGISIVCVVLN
jgi:hypothetical protein